MGTSEKLHGGVARLFCFAKAVCASVQLGGLHFRNFWSPEQALACGGAIWLLPVNLLTWENVQKWSGLDAPHVLTVGLSWVQTRIVCFIRMMGEF